MNSNITGWNEKNIIYSTTKQMLSAIGWIFIYKYFVDWDQHDPVAAYTVQNLVPKFSDISLYLWSFIAYDHQTTYLLRHFIFNTIWKPFLFYYCLNKVVDYFQWLWRTLVGPVKALTVLGKPMWYFYQYWYLSLCRKCKVSLWLRWKIRSLRVPAYSSLR